MRRGKTLKVYSRPQNLFQNQNKNRDLMFKSKKIKNEKNLRLSKTIRRTVSEQMIQGEN